MLGGWFYLMYTDTTGPARARNGAGQFVLRAHDAAFSVGRAGAHRVRVPAAATTQPVKQSIVDAFSADWMWVDALHAFAVAHETTAGTTITFLGPDLVSPARTSRW